MILITSVPAIILCKPFLLFVQPTIMYPIKMINVEMILAKCRPVALLKEIQWFPSDWRWIHNRWPINVWLFSGHTKTQGHY